MINFLGEVNFQGQRKRIAIKQNDRNHHIYIVGKTGVGKITLLKSMIIQDILNNQGVCFIDPYGDSAEDLLDFIPKNKINDVVYFNVGDLEYPIAFNIIYNLNDENYHLVALGLVEALKKIWADVWSVQMEYILFNSIMALLEFPNGTLLGINKMLNNKSYREKVVANIKNPLIKNFWQKEYSLYIKKYQDRGNVSIQDKIDQLFSSSFIYNIIGQIKSRINFEEIINKKKILIVNLSEPKIGKQAVIFLGSLLTLGIQNAVLARDNIASQNRDPFYLYIDEFQNFIGNSFISILSEARKYHLSLILSHQHIVKQIDKEIVDAIFDNIGTIICFKTTTQDALYLEKEFSPSLKAYDMVNLEKYYFYLKLMFDGISQRPFLVKGLFPFPYSKYSNKSKIIKFSQKRHGIPVNVIENKINSWVKV